MPRFWHLGGMSWRQLAGNVWHEILEDDVFGQAAKLSFYFLLALFPLLLFLTTLFGYFAQSADLRDSLLEYFRRVVPRSAFRLVLDTLNQITAGAGGGKLSIGLLATLWAASNGMAAITDGLNTAYDIKDSRSWWKYRFISLALTLAFALFTVIGLVLVLAGEKLGAFLAHEFGLEAVFTTVWSIGRWPVVLLVVLFAVNLLYRFAPNLEEWRWRWMTPGALTAVALWLLVSLGFRFYLRFFNTYNATYGSLGAVIILMLWFYMTGAAILIGAEVNSEIENAAAREGEPDARLRGQKRPRRSFFRRHARQPQPAPADREDATGS